MLLTTVLFSTLAMAEDSEFEGAAEAGQEFGDKEAHVSAEFGGAMATGNSDFVVGNGTLIGSYKEGKNKVSAHAGLNRGRAVVDADEDGVLSKPERGAGRVDNVRRYFVDARYDRFVGKKDSVYVLAGAFHDRFAGFELRAHEQVGYSRLLVNEEETKFRAELGFDVAHEFYVDGIDPQTQLVPAVRLLLGIHQKLSDTASFENTFEIYENVIDTADVRIINHAAITAKISDPLSLKISHALIFDNVPVPGFAFTDQTTLATVVVNFM